MFRLSSLFILFPLALAARILWAVLRPRARSPIGRLVLDAVFVTYLVTLGQVVLGFSHLGGFSTDFSPWSRVNLVPLRTIGEVARPDLAATAIGQAVGNVSLFVPLGALLPLTAARFRTFRRVLMAGFLLSLGIEIVQLGLLLGRLMDRSADVDDVILNAMGTLLGYAIWILLLGGPRREAETARPCVEGEGRRPGESAVD